MGASFNTMTLAGNLTRKEVQAQFADAQDCDRYENGHSYSGGFGQARGLKFASRTFDTEPAASAWLDENCQKFGDAIAVTFKGENGGAQWMIGALCAC